MIHSERQGLTLVDVLVIVVVLGIFLAMVVPFLLQTREDARKNQCKNHLKRIGLGIHNYQDAHRMLTPGAESWSEFPDLQVSATVEIAPFFEQGHWWGGPEPDAWRVYDSNVSATFVPDFACPANGTEETTDSFWARCAFRQATSLASAATCIARARPMPGATIRR